MAAHEFDARRRMISKTFYQNLRASERQALVGPPESMREHAVAAARAMRRGDWRACLNYIVNEKMNAKVSYKYTPSKAVRSVGQAGPLRPQHESFLLCEHHINITVKMLGSRFYFNRNIPESRDIYLLPH